MSVSTICSFPRFVYSLLNPVHSCPDFLKELAKTDCHIRATNVVFWNFELGGLVLISWTDCPWKHGLEWSGGGLSIVLRAVRMLC